MLSCEFSPLTAIPFGSNQSAVLLLVATILDFIRLLVIMAIYIHTLLEPWLKDRRYYSWNPDVELIVQPLFNFIPMFVILVLLFTIGVRKQKGLWSRPQPGWSFTAALNTTVAPAAPAGHVPVPMAHAPAAAQPVAPTQGLPAYLAVAQQLQQQQQYAQAVPGWPQGQQMQPTYAQPVPPHQGGYYYQPQQPAPGGDAAK